MDDARAHDDHQGQPANPPDGQSSPFDLDEHGYPKDPYAPLPPGAPRDEHAATVAAVVAQPSPHDEDDEAFVRRVRELTADANDPKKNRGMLWGAFAAGIGGTIALLVIIGIVIGLVKGDFAGDDNSGTTSEEQSAAQQEDAGNANQPAEFAPGELPTEVGDWTAVLADPEVYSYAKGDSPRRITVAPMGSTTPLETWTASIDGERTDSADGRVACGESLGSPTCYLETAAHGVIAITTLDDDIEVSEMLAIGEAIAAGNP